jgi:hypothetical protein
MTPCNLSVTVLTNALPTHYNTIRTETAMVYNYNTTELFITLHSETISMVGRASQYTHDYYPCYYYGVLFSTLFSLFESSTPIAMIRSDWAPFRNRDSYVLWRGLDASQILSHALVRTCRHFEPPLLIPQLGIVFQSVSYESRQANRRSMRLPSAQD